MKPLQNLRVLSLAINLPGPLAVGQLQQLGASVVKIEPPQGDPLDHARPQWYATLHQGQQVLRLDLKEETERARLNPFLAQADLLVTATRPSALDRLGLAWPELHGRYPRLCQVAIVGYAAPREDVPGHDLNYQAHLGLVVPPHMPRTCIADLAGAQRVVSASLGVLLGRERGQGSRYVQVSLGDAAEEFASPLRYGLTAPGGILGGGFPGYNLYCARQGWVAVAALEPHFWKQLQQELGLTELTHENLQRVFLTRSDQEWEAWAAGRDLPITAVREAPPALSEPRA
jgi:crotonobetainyl-CoA:carnitine CoA-transferase CaiB-like acyl-CoA transferase